mgnify:CR=1 FL=1
MTVAAFVRPFLSAGLRARLQALRTPSRDRYAHDDVARVQRVTAEQWRTASARSVHYLGDYARETATARTWARSQWLALQPEFARAASALELGCAAGRNLVALREAHPALALFGVDINREAVAHAASSVPGAALLVGDLYDAGRILSGLPRPDVILTVGTLIHLHPATLPRLLQQMALYAQRSLLLCEQVRIDNEVVKGPAWWRPTRKVTGDYIQWSPNLYEMLRALGLRCDVRRVPAELQSNGARDLIAVHLRRGAPRDAVAWL